MRASVYAKLVCSSLLIMIQIPEAGANSLRVAPILLDVSAPGATTTLNLRNEGGRNIYVQMRVFRWSGTQSEPQLEPTSDVVVSPPAATLTPGMDYVVRVVRVTKQPISGEESYRVLVDEIPDRTGNQANTVRFALRYSIPVFFTAPSASAANVAWSLAVKGKTAILTATNSGGRRARFANLKLIDGSGAAVIKRPGLFGYALGRSSTAWTLPDAGRLLPRGPLRVIADSETGATDAAVALQQSR